MRFGEWSSVWETKKLGEIPTDLLEKIQNCTDLEKLDQIIDNIFDIGSFNEIEEFLK